MFENLLYSQILRKKCIDEWKKEANYDISGKIYDTIYKRRIHFLLILILLSISFYGRSFSNDFSPPMMNQWICDAIFHVSHVISFCQTFHANHLTDSIIISFHGCILYVSEGGFI